MRKYLLQLGVFLITILLIAILIEIWIFFKWKNHSAFGHDNWHLLDNRKADLVILGNSRAWVQFDPQAIKDSCNIEVVNLGIDGHGTDVWLSRLKQYLKKNPSPKWVWVQIDGMEEYWGGRNDFYLKDSLLTYLFLNRMDVRSHFSHLKGYDYFDEWIPLYRFMGNQEAFLQMVFGKPRIDRPLGFQAMNKHFISMDTIYRNRRIPKEKYLKGLNHILEMKKLCDQHKTQFIVVHAPILEPYYKSQLDLPQWKSDLAQNQIPFIDFNPLFPHQDTSLFYNTAHLNSKGVKKFNNILVDLVNNY